VHGLACVEWLESLGFDKAEHIIPDGLLDVLHYCDEHVTRVWATEVFQYNFDELFEFLGDWDAFDLEEREEMIKSEGDKLYFPIYTAGFTGWYEVKDTLIEILSKFTFVFDVRAENLMIQIGGDGLLNFRYQTIIGGRYVATIKDHTTFETKIRQKLKDAKI
jgi:hypothetical protein